MMTKIMNHRDLEAYRRAFEAAMEIFRLSKQFPVEERYSLTDRIRRSSRSVCANFAEGWRRRRYEGSFIDKTYAPATERPEDTENGLRLRALCVLCGDYTIVRKY